MTKYDTMGEMLDFIALKKIPTFYLFADYCMKNNNQWFRTLVDNVEFFAAVFEH